MKKFISFCLMLTMLLTFTEKVTALTPMSKMQSSLINSCDAPIETELCVSKMGQTMDCQNDCDMMKVEITLDFIAHTPLLLHIMQVNYPRTLVSSPYHFSDPLDRPPFLS